MSKEINDSYLKLAILSDTKLMNKLMQQVADIFDKHYKEPDEAFFND